MKSHKDFPRCPIVDTGPLFDFLIWEYAKHFTKLSLLSSTSCIKNETEWKAIQWYFGYAKPIFTSPGVIAEITGLLKSRMKFSDIEIGSFWLFAKQPLIQLGLDEELIKFKDMEVHLIQQFFPTDTSLIKIAQQHQLHIFTADGKLSSFCRKNNISVLEIHDIVTFQQESI
ncbi:MAG: hypothetical protein AB1393_03015 [Candidatus Edwardsbacteria bacterium]